MNERCAFALIASLGLLFPAFAATSSAGDFALKGYLTGGGDLASGGDFQLFGGIADTDASSSSGDQFTLTGGFVPQLTMAVPPGEIFLEIALTEGGIEISWPSNVTGFTLESTTALGPDASWEAVAGSEQSSSIVIQPGESARFFRMTSD